MEKLLIGVEIGGTKLQTVLGTPRGEILSRYRGDVDPARGAEGILAWMETSITDTLADCPAGKQVAGIGVGFGGPVESATGRILTSHQVDGWDGVLLRNWIETRFSLPTIVANDSNAAGWAEYCLGAGQGTQNFVYCNIGSGIGGALVVNGDLYDGQGFGACEIGHTYVPDWTAERPGAMDKLENLCSGWSITRRIRGWSNVAAKSPLAQLCNNTPATLTCPMLAEAARQGDPVALGEVHAVAAAIGTALTNVATLLHPERIALGGGVALMGDVLLDAIATHIDQTIFGAYRGHYQLVSCALEEDVVTTGALLLIDTHTNS